MAYTISVTANYTTVTSVSTQTRVVVTATATPIFTITNTVQSIGITDNLTTITVYTDAVELLVDDFANYYTGDWVSGKTYRRGHIANYEYSLYVCSTGTYTSLTSSVTPPDDLGYLGTADSLGNYSNGNWRRVVWNEAPRDFLTVTNHLSAGSLSVGGIGGDGLTINSTATFNGPVKFNNTVTFSDTATYSVSNFQVNNQFTNNGLADFYGQNATFHTTATFSGTRTYISSATVNNMTVLGQANFQDSLTTRFLTANDNQHFHADTLIDNLYLQSNWVALGYDSYANTGATSPFTAGVAIGQNASAGAASVAIGWNASADDVAVSLGKQSYATNASVAIGVFANLQRQPSTSVVIGAQAHGGNSRVGSGTGYPANNSVILGYNAGYNFSGTNAVIIGTSAGQGYSLDGDDSVLLGYEAGGVGVGNQTVAIGRGAGFENQGNGSIAIGYRAGNYNQAPTSIILNATGGVVDNTTTGSFVVAPVRGEIATDYAMYYNTVTNEVSYSNKLNLSFGRIVN